MAPTRTLANIAFVTLTLLAAVFQAGRADARGFSGFNDSFNLGRSSSSGAVCQAQRNFDDPVVGQGRRAWDVTCRGWSQKLGTLYVFDHAGSADQVQAWRAALLERTDCDPSKLAVTKAGSLACKTRPAGLDYVVLARPGKGSAVAAEGMAAIADILATGAKFVSGAIDEPAAVAEQTASVSQVTSSELGALALAGQTAGASVDARMREAYERNQEWRFDDAEAVFGELAAPASDGSGPTGARVEALYNFALNVSNKGRFDEADVYFTQADAAAREATIDSSLKALALNYKAAHARNQRHYEDAVTLADAAIAARAASVREDAVSKGDDGAVKINDVYADASAARLTDAQRDTMRDVQALQIKGTALEALGQEDAARAALNQAVALLQRPLFGGASEDAQAVRLEDASPWLSTRVRADLLRLNRNVGRSAEAIPQMRTAIAAFGSKYPGSLPLAGFLIELARAEGAVGTTDKAAEDQALADYEAAFEIFRKQRGSLEASADLVGKYFDILLQRIGSSPADHAKETAQFFSAAQTLVAQSTAEAAKRQAARMMASDQKSAGLARALEDSDRTIATLQAQVRSLQEHGLYQGAAKTQADAELQAMVQQTGALEQQLLAADPGYASALRSLVGLDELQKALKPDEAYVKIFVLANRSYGLLITRTMVKPYPVELSRVAAQNLVDNLRDPIDQTAAAALGPYDVALAHDAFLKLFGPVQDDLLKAGHVIYEPDATLIGAPLAALVVDDASVEVMKRNQAQASASGKPASYAGVAWLGARVTSSIALSPAAFVQARAAPASKATEPFFGFADPQISHDPRAFASVTSQTLLEKTLSDYCARVRQGLYNLEPLPETAEEVRTVAASLGQDKSKYVIGGAFTDTDLMKRGSAVGDLSSYRVLYFATHGVLLPANDCVDAALVTSLGEGDSDALLDVKRKIPQLVLDADLVVLSACDTGRSNGGGGDALGGLVKTFVQAGARNLLVSNWKVDSVATEQLMIDVFKAKTTSQADALARAERAMMSSPGEYSHPYYWAAFMLVGDGARQMPAV